MLKIIRLIAGFVSGTFTIRFLSITNSNDISVIFSELILDPVQFFLGMISFFVCFISFAGLIRGFIEDIYFLFTDKKISFLSLLLNGSVSICFYFLMKDSFWLTIALIAFSIFYGIISVDLKRKVYEVNH